MIAITSPVSPLRGVFPLEELLHRGLLLEVGGDGVWPEKCIGSKVHPNPPPLPLPMQCQCFIILIAWYSSDTCWKNVRSGQSRRTSLSICNSTSLSLDKEFVTVHHCPWTKNDMKQGSDFAFIEKEGECCSWGKIMNVKIQKSEYLKKVCQLLEGFGFNGWSSITGEFACGCHCQTV